MIKNLELSTLCPKWLDLKNCTYLVLGDFLSNQYDCMLLYLVYLSFHFKTCFYTYILALSITLSAFWCSHFRTQMFLCPRMLCNESSLKIMRFKLFTTNGRKSTLIEKRPDLQWLKYKQSYFFKYLRLTIHSVEISWFFYHADFTWNQFRGF